MSELVVFKLQTGRNLRQLTQDEYCQLLVDHGVNWYTSARAEQMARAYLEMGQEFDPARPVPAKAPQFLEVLDFIGESTRRRLVSWVPRIVPGSAWKKPEQQLGVLGQIRRQKYLPAYHLSGFGKRSLNADLIRKHHEVTGEKVPFDGYGVNTDTYIADGDRRRLCWHGGALGSGSWCGGARGGSCGDGSGLGGWAAFAQGVEKLRGWWGTRL